MASATDVRPGGAQRLATTVRRSWPGIRPVLLRVGLATGIAAAAGSAAAAVMNLLIATGLPLDAAEAAVRRPLA